MRTGMWRLLIFGAMLLTIMASITPAISGESFKAEKKSILLHSILKGNNRTIIVDDEGDGNATTINSAIEIAYDGDIILVYSGTYYENVVVNKKISIIGIPTEYGNGSDIGKPVIDGNNVSDVVLITSDNVILTNFTIRYCGSEMDPTTGGWLWCDAGIELQSNYSTIFNNEIIFSDVGMFLNASSNNNISDNYFIEDHYGSIYLFKSYQNNISDNIMINCSMALDKSYNNNVVNNSINGKPLVYLEEESGKIIDYPTGEILLVKCENITITNQDFNNITVCIELFNSTSCEIVHNNFKDCVNEIVLIISTNNHIYYNTFNNSHDAVVIWNDRCINNMIWYNIFINTIAWDFSKINYNNWDNGTVGNYWSDQGVRIDTNHDNISEFPYFFTKFSSVIVDRHPLMPSHPRVEPILPGRHPPTINVLVPKEGYLYIDNNEISEIGITLLVTFPRLGPLTLKVGVESYYPVNPLYGVKVFIDLNLSTNTFRDCPSLTWIFPELYQVNLDKPLIGKHTLTFVANDIYGFSADPVEMDIICFYFP